MVPLCLHLEGACCSIVCMLDVHVALSMNALCVLSDSFVILTTVGMRLSAWWLLDLQGGPLITNDGVLFRRVSIGVAAPSWCTLLREVHNSSSH